MSDRLIQFTIAGKPSGVIVPAEPAWGRMWNEMEAEIPYMPETQKYYARLAILIGELLPPKKSELQIDWAYRAMKNYRLIECLEKMVPFPARHIEGGFEEFGGPNRARSVFTLIKSVTGPVAPRTGSYEWIWDILSQVRIITPPPVPSPPSLARYYFGPILDRPAEKSRSPSYPPPVGSTCICGYDHTLHMSHGDIMVTAEPPITPAVAGDDLLPIEGGAACASSPEPL